MRNMDSSPSEKSPIIMYRHVGVQNAPTRVEGSTASAQKEFVERGADHAYTCWGNNPFDETDPAAVVKWVKRVERSDGYAAAVAVVCRRLETVLKASKA